MEGIEFRRNPDDSIEIRRNQWKLWNSIKMQRIQKNFVEIHGNYRVPDQRNPDENSTEIQSI